MAKLEHETDVTTVDPSQGFSPVPPGDYKLIVAESDYVPTKDETGMRLTLTMQIVEGEYEGKKIFEGLNLKNKSEEAEKIAWSQYSALVKALKLKHKPEDSEELHDIPFMATVGIQASPGYEPRNVIKKYIFDNGKKAADATTSVAGTKPAKKNGSTKPAWA